MEYKDLKKKQEQSLQCTFIKSQNVQAQFKIQQQPISLSQLQNHFTRYSSMGEDIPKGVNIFEFLAKLQSPKDIDNKKQKDSGISQARDKLPEKSKREPLTTRNIVNDDINNPRAKRQGWFQSSEIKGSNSSLQENFFSHLKHKK
eukprot:403346011